MCLHQEPGGNLRSLRDIGVRGGDLAVPGPEHLHHVLTLGHRKASLKNVNLQFCLESRVASTRPCTGASRSCWVVTCARVRKCCLPRLFKNICGLQNPIPSGDRSRSQGPSSRLRGPNSGGLCCRPPSPWTRGARPGSALCSLTSAPGRSPHAGTHRFSRFPRVSRLSVYICLILSHQDSEVCMRIGIGTKCASESCRESSGRPLRSPRLGSSGGAVLVLQGHQPADGRGGGVYALEGPVPV